MDNKLKAKPHKLSLGVTKLAEQTLKGNQLRLVKLTSVSSTIITYDLNRCCD